MKNLLTNPGRRWWFQSSLKSIGVTDEWRRRPKTLVVSAFAGGLIGLRGIHLFFPRQLLIYFLKTLAEHRSMYFPFLRPPELSMPPLDVREYVNTSECVCDVGGMMWIQVNYTISGTGLFFLFFLAFAAEVLENAVTTRWPPPAPPCLPPCGTIGNDHPNRSK